MPVTYRDQGRKRSLVLVHGLSGEESWRPLLDQLMVLPELEGWDIHAFGYVTRWLPRWLRYRLVSAPDLARLANVFATYCQSNLSRYRNLAVLGHSAGGLIALDALLRYDWLRERTTHLALLGAPVGGVGAARLLGPVSPQFRDLTRGSRFLLDLQRRLDTEPLPRSYALRVVAGTDDTTLLMPSVFAHFHESVQRTVPGDHVSMIQPTGPDATIVRVIVDLLTSPRIFLSYVREDQDAVIKVFDALQARELLPWMDQRRLEPGEIWHASIMEALRSSDRFLVFLSPTSSAELKRDGVFLQEVETAIGIQDERGEPSPFVIPVRLPDLNDSDIPPQLARYQMFDLSHRGSDDLAHFLETTTAGSTVAAARVAPEGCVG